MRAEQVDPIIAGAGASVVFSSLATNLVAGDTNGKAGVFRWPAA